MKRNIDGEPSCLLPIELERHRRFGSKGNPARRGGKDAAARRKVVRKEAPNHGSPPDRGAVDRHYVEETVVRLSEGGDVPDETRRGDVGHNRVDTTRGEAMLRGHGELRKGVFPKCAGEQSDESTCPDGLTVAAGGREGADEGCVQPSRQPEKKHPNQHSVPGRDADVDLPRSQSGNNRGCVAWISWKGERLPGYVAAAGRDKPHRERGARTCQHPTRSCIERAVTSDGDQDIGITHCGHANRIVGRYRNRRLHLGTLLGEERGDNS